MEWLRSVKKTHTLNFDVQNIACRGDAFDQFTKEDLITMLGNTKAAIIIFNQKQSRASGAFFCFLFVKFCISISDLYRESLKNTSFPSALTAEAASPTFPGTLAQTSG